MDGDVAMNLKNTNQLKENGHKSCKDVFAHPSLEVDTSAVITKSAGCVHWLIYEQTAVNELAP